MGRNCLLGHRKKIAKFLTWTFTSLSTFLYRIIGKKGLNNKGEMMVGEGVGARKNM